MISVLLSRELLSRIKEYAKKRQTNAEKRQLNNYRKSNDSDVKIHEAGLWGEAAFARVTGLKAETKVDETDLYDFMLPDGRTIDVKHTKWKTGTLMLGPRAEKDHSRLADIYVLTTGIPPFIDVVGYIDSETLWNHFEPHPKIKAYKRWLPQEKLIPIEEMIKTIDF